MNGESMTPSPAPSSRGTFLRTIGEFLRLALIAAAIAIPIRYFVAQPFIVRGASMEPNFYDLDYLVVDELSYYFRMPERGEVVVLHYPLNPSEYFIKRIIGLPGETVTVDANGVTIINQEYPKGVRLDEPYLPKGLPEGANGRFTLGQNEYVVLGDNRPFSSDSRVWGELDKKYITGRVIIRAWPLQEFGIIKKP